MLLFVVLNDFSDDEVQKLLGEFGIEVSLFRQIFEPCNLTGFAVRIGRGKVVFGFEFPHSLCVFEPLAQRIDKDRVETVDRGALARLLLYLRAASACGVPYHVCVRGSGRGTAPNI